MFQSEFEYNSPMEKDNPDGSQSVMINGKWYEVDSEGEIIDDYQRYLECFL